MAFQGSPLAGFSFGYMGYAGQKAQETQNAFEDLRRRMESDAKASAERADVKASLGAANGIFSPLNGYDHSAAGAWSQANQGYVTQSSLNMFF
jgi:hypothetical protein